ncbi:BatD family protein [Adhaeribacter soli]|uniref:Protein BatD n=1 Tax=Adhaeribacter soli TaxID=2607655 RepID=A0A5N1IUI5_9BACT|nr:BatD family protein [Adhaeribacter soli]KAA9333680.1 protein BatD [Adhaeribacter soli]
MKNFCVLFCFLLIPFLPVAAQEVIIKLGKSPVPIDEYFTISVTLKNQQLKNIGKFPDLEGFEKSNRFSSTTTNIVNGQISTEQTITQNYAALKEGEIEIEPFSIEVNGKAVESKGGTVKVVPSTGQAPPGTGVPPVQGFGLLDELFGKQKPQEYIDKQEDAFLAFSTSKNEVFVGEGLSVHLAFYIASADQNLVDFHNFNRQITPIIKKLKPSSVWEESFELTGEPEAVSIDGKAYLRFKLYESVYYPINTDPLLFPSVGLEMIKYKIAKDPSFLGDNRMATSKMYYTSPKIVHVKALPPHPLREAVPVGNYRLHEGIDRDKFLAGKSFNYLFQIEGEGNLAAIATPEPTATPGLEFTAPDIRQDINRQNGRVSGRKGFRYFATPKTPGTYDFSNIFSFIFFNPDAGKYDTLRSELKIVVTGEADNDATIQSKDMGEFYQRIGNESNTLQSIHQFSEVKLYTNLVVLFLLLVSLYLFYKHRL